MMVLTQTLAQTVTFHSCYGVSWISCGFSVPQMRQFCLLAPPESVKWASSIIKIPSKHLVQCQPFERLFCCISSDVDIL